MPAGGVKEERCRADNVTLPAVHSLFLAGLYEPFFAVESTTER